MHIEIRHLPTLILFNYFTINVDDCFLVYFMDKYFERLRDREGQGRASHSHGRSQRQSLARWQLAAAGGRLQLVSSAGPRAEVSVEDFRDAQRVHLALQRGVANPLTIKCMG